jgi:hypothetical protein
LHAGGSGDHYLQGERSSFSTIAPTALLSGYLNLFNAHRLRHSLFKMFTMEVTCTLKLCKDDGDPDYGLWLESSGTYDIDSIHYVAAGNEPHTTEGAHYRVVLKVESNTGNGPYHHPVLHTVHLGGLADPNKAAELTVDMMAGNARVGGGKVKLSSAEQTSRPKPWEKQ